MVVEDVEGEGEGDVGGSVEGWFGQFLLETQWHVGVAEYVVDSRADRKPSCQMPLVQAPDVLGDIRTCVLDGISCLPELVGIDGRVVGYGCEVMLKFVIV